MSKVWCGSFGCEVRTGRAGVCVRGLGGRGSQAHPDRAITLADARMLVEALGTDDVIDPTIGDRVFRTTSSQELLHLTLIVEWAKSARLVRKTGHRLVPVKKNQALLDDAPALWFTLFTVFDQLGEAFLPSGFGESLLRREFADRHPRRVDLVVLRRRCCRHRESLRDGLERRDRTIRPGPRHRDPTQALAQPATTANQAGARRPAAVGRGDHRVTRRWS